jgi:hypothetical protein
MVYLPIFSMSLRAREFYSKAGRIASPGAAGAAAAIKNIGPRVLLFFAGYSINRVEKERPGNHFSLGQGASMQSTYDPQTIYDVFDRYGFAVLRIDQFDRGNYAKIRAELKYDRLTVDHLLEITTKLKSLEKNENVEISIINIDMIHKTMRLNISTKEEESTVKLT